MLPFKYLLLMITPNRPMPRLCLPSDRVSVLSPVELWAAFGSSLVRWFYFDVNTQGLDGNSGRGGVHSISRLWWHTVARIVSLKNQGDLIRSKKNRKRGYVFFSESEFHDWWQLQDRGCLKRHDALSQISTYRVPKGCVMLPSFSRLFMSKIPWLHNNFLT